MVSILFHHPLSCLQAPKLLAPPSFPGVLSFGYGTMAANNNLEWYSFSLFVAFQVCVGGGGKRENWWDGIMCPWWLGICPTQAEASVSLEANPCPELCTGREGKGPPGAL